MDLPTGTMSHYYKFDEASGTITYDSGNVHTSEGICNGTLVGGGSLPFSTAGKSNGA